MGSRVSRSSHCNDRQRLEECVRDHIRVYSFVLKNICKIFICFLRERARVGGVERERERDS